MRLSVTETLAGEVIATGKSVRVNRALDKEPIKVKTGFLVEAVVFVPLTLGGVTFGVLAAAQNEPGKRINARDEKLINTVAEFTAIAVQNARVYQATDHALSHRVKLLTAISYALSQTFKQQINSVIGYAGLLDVYNDLDDDSLDLLQHIIESGNQMATLIDQLIEITNRNDNPFLEHKLCDLVDEATSAINDLHSTAAQRDVNLQLQVIGDPIMVMGDAAHLHRSMWNLLDNAIRYSPVGGDILLSLVFSPAEVLIHVRDWGPGIPEEDLPFLFDRYYRGQQMGNNVGIGLGLELVRATARAHRGTVTARNADGGGAEFIISLPSALYAS
jgi:signal transduction histidine kinase